MISRLFALLLALGLIAPGLISLALAFPTAAEERFITVASTTSTVNSGLMDTLLPLFEKTTGIRVRMVAVGTGQALRLARNGDVDVLLVHHRASEDAFVADGFGVRRYDVMVNDFVVVGPAEDPAGVKETTAIGAALRRIADNKAIFLSRGDNSGTHMRERALWQAASIDPAAASGTWYRETGAGMGATLNTARAMGAYTLADLGTWLGFRNRAGMTVVSEGDAGLGNPYGIILVDPRRHPHVKAADGQAFIDWMTGPQGQAAIRAFRVNGENLFRPNAKSTFRPD